MNFVTRLMQFSHCCASEGGRLNPTCPEDEKEIGVCIWGGGGEIITLVHGLVTEKTA